MTVLGDDQPQQPDLARHAFLWLLIGITGAIERAGCGIFRNWYD
jgi:hypothetical protein